MSEMLVWEVTITKSRKNKIKKFHVLAEFSIQAAHIVENLIFEEFMFGDPENIEIIGINKVKSIKKLVNFNNDEEMGNKYDPEMPYKLLENKNFPADEVIKFKCDCKNNVVVANFEWPYIECKSCKRQILHRDLELVSGMWLFHPSN